MPARLASGSYRGQCGKHMLAASSSHRDPNGTSARSVWRLTIWVPEEQAPLPQSALASSRRGGRSTHSASLAGYSGGQVINSGILERNSLRIGEVFALL